MTVAVGYVRVSTSEQADSGLGLEAQRARIESEAGRRQWDLSWQEDAGYSGSTMKRPALAHALEQLRTGKADVLVVAKLDRLSRSAQDFANTMAAAKREGWELVALDLGVDTTTPSGRLMAGVMAQFAEYERELIATRTRDALSAAKARGQRLGRPRETSDEVVAQVLSLHHGGMSPHHIAQALTADGIPTTRGAAQWRASTVRRLIRGHALDLAAVSDTDLSEEVA